MHQHRFVAGVLGVMGLALAAFSAWRYWVDGVGLDDWELAAPVIWQWHRLVEFGGWLLTWPAVLIPFGAIFVGGVLEASAERADELRPQDPFGDR